ncbi:phenylalanine--tRNA ligase subunit beta [Polynucleobacter paneuropaeus]|jgi:phenylalanyl-tRNA synthetase beta chain|uniref:phenylalanine--tRNA ligase subunit beta n=1 Tax=Polynucleobacter paneuropaeus TaxID=2527775 RepID=UPI000DBF30AB|nr:phenylalanine--tRNA ligase subunit beta [Polynucleobacter paneuropaeus]AWW48049.1 phenylalanine--tRNA ligase subunit beta [Polynucleobacter paneuropaeus]MBT8516168.1 phenylalanine--tRNA ligase subunit beta [Polynucleobacter paneuropaeus]MBT8518217.1 phenylalanine--tRNA ligase subunit beta [Polynucleobacter paneuropaeus]MBT8531504.1 phenylalanine--tRNA ligase subunit beta [Polynucleobacter paneuropaeus]MBT8542776.1 phenylalanine--tRNA ligase subunit beta [Polynucleobacter paneuropaeus]
MQFSESWLRQYVNPELDSAALGHAMTMAGLELEEQRSVAPAFTQIVVAQILSAEQHPDADRLRVCKVNAGTGQELQIVCGAPNARPGIKIPCALVGAQLPPSEVGGKPFQIKVGKLRGVESQGMLCSGKELGLGDDHEGILELPADAPVGKDIRQYLDLDDQIFVIKLTPNKADCLSLVGMAREVAAITGAVLKKPEWKAVPASIKDQRKVIVENTELCGRFAGRVIQGVNAKAKTPDWIVQRLARAGQRSISALVDLSNYVMLEVGQPSHVFDLDKVTGDIIVRWAKTGEQLELLNGQTVQLVEQNNPKALSIGVVADQNGPLALAGIMGGNHCAVSDDTRNIFVEAAYWQPNAIQGRARRFNFSTDAAHRFERGVDPQATVDCLEYLSALIIQVCGGQAGPINDQVLAMPERKSVKMRLDRASKVIGIPLTTQIVSGVFQGLNFDFKLESDTFIVTPPSYRFDIEIEEDLIEEVARMYGFENIPDHPPVASLKMSAKPEAKRAVHLLRQRFALQGYQEAVNFGFIDAESEKRLVGAGDATLIKVLNPIASQYGVMRSNLWGGLLNNLKANLNRGATRVRLFETGRVFKRDAGVTVQPGKVAGFNQPQRIGGLAYGSFVPEQWANANRFVDFFDVKGDLERVFDPLHLVTETAQHPALHPGRSAQVMMKSPEGPVILGWIGELHPGLQQAYELPQAPILFELDLELLRNVGLPQPEELSKFPAVQRDLAVVVKQNIAAQVLLDAMYASKPHFVRSIELFDEFRPKAGSASMAEDEKSLAFRVTLLNPEDTLQDAQIEGVMSGLLAALEKKCAARLR